MKVIHHSIYIIIGIILLPTLSIAKNEFKISPFSTRFKISHPERAIIHSPLLNVVCSNTEGSLTSSKTLPIEFSQQVISVLRTTSFIRIENKKPQQFKNPFPFSFFGSRDCMVHLAIAVEDPYFPSEPSTVFNEQKVSGALSHYSFQFEGTKQVGDQLGSMTGMEFLAQHYREASPTSPGSTYYNWYFTLHPSHETDINVETYPYLYTRSNAIPGDQYDPEGR